MSGPPPGKPGKGRGRRPSDKEELVGQFVEVSGVCAGLEDRLAYGGEGCVSWVKGLTRVGG